MRNIEASDWLADPRLEIIQKKGKGRSKKSESDTARSFVMQLTQVRKEQNTEQKKK
jgi:Tfp pilus assembly protein PilN